MTGSAPYRINLEDIKALGIHLVCAAVGAVLTVWSTGNTDWHDCKIAVLTAVSSVGLSAVHRFAADNRIDLAEQK
jgi:hypothetical protein